MVCQTKVLSDEVRRGSRFCCCSTAASTSARGPDVATAVVRRLFMVPWVVEPNTAGVVGNRIVVRASVAQPENREDRRLDQHGGRDESAETGNDDDGERHRDELRSGRRVGEHDLHPFHDAGIGHCEPDSR